MKKNLILADKDNPLVIQTAKRITEGKNTDREKLESIFYFVRDDIKFAFPPKGDLMSASETLRYGKGQCNTKSTLFQALCGVAGIPVKVHFSLITKDIQRGLFTGIAYRMMPNEISHSWVEVEIEGKWRRIDSFINDEDFYLAGRNELKARNWDTGFSVACSSGESSAAFNIENEKFVQMDAVTEDHGLWDEPADYYASDRYKNRPNAFKLLMYRILLRGINKRVQTLRMQCSGGLCRKSSAA